MPEDAKKNDLLVTEVEIIPLKTCNGHIGFASFVLNHQIFIGNIAIYSRPNGSGLRCVFPTKRLPTGGAIQLVHPITKEAGLLIEKAVFEQYKKVVIKSGEEKENRNLSWRQG